MIWNFSGFLSTRGNFFRRPLCFFFPSEKHIRVTATEEFSHREIGYICTIQFFSSMKHIGDTTWLIIELVRTI
jgi:hypothetical protein